LCLIYFTPISKYLQTKKTVDRGEFIKIMDQTDSLAILVEQQSRWIENFTDIASGKINLDDIDSLYLTDFKPNLVNLDDHISENESDLRLYVERQNNLLNTLDFHKPTKGILVDTFDLKINHLGVDLSTKEKEKIFSVLDGSVLISGENEEFGKFIIINHEENIMSIYMHASNIIKERGDSVKRGGIIGYTGNTGSLSNGTHLHFELKHNGLNVDPQDYIIF
tara:strand:+ start:364 stop:1029 length:666 start_codon:yes stop_codon:yes gene_type:complete